MDVECGSWSWTAFRSIVSSSVVVTCHDFMTLQPDPRDPRRTEKTNSFVKSIVCVGSDPVVGAVGAL